MSVAELFNIDVKEDKEFTKLLNELNLDLPLLRDDLTRGNNDLVSLVYFQVLKCVKTELKDKFSTLIPKSLFVYDFYSYSCYDFNKNCKSTDRTNFIKLLNSLNSDLFSKNLKWFKNKIEENV